MSSIWAALRILSLPPQVKGLAVAARTGGHDAIEHIDAALDGADDIGWCSYAHKVTRFRSGQERRRVGKRLEHELLAFADRKPANRIAIEVHGCERFGGLGAKLRIDAALHDAE